MLRQSSAGVGWLGEGWVWILLTDAIVGDELAQGAQAKRRRKKGWESPFGEEIGEHTASLKTYQTASCSSF